jgi:hypothetical protein
MKHLIPLAAALLAACVALLLLVGAVQSSPSLDRVAEPPARPQYAYTRIVTVTVGSSTVPTTTGLTSRWQFETIDQVVSGTYEIPLPGDAYEISVALPITVYHIDPGPTLIITGPQTRLYYEYKTDQRALRFGNQILITQTASNNQEYRYLATLTFAGPYEYLGTSGFAPTATTASTISWDVVPPIDAEARYRFNASTWLVDPRLIGPPPLIGRPDLKIITANVLRQLNHIYVTANIQNIGPMMAWAPVYINLYDRVAPTATAPLTPTGPLDLVDGWCSLTPISACGDSVNNPLPAVSPGQTVIFTAEYDLSAIDGRHNIYLFVDALGGQARNQGLNVESDENHNVVLAGSLFRLGKVVFLPLIRR